MMLSRHMPSVGPYEGLRVAHCAKCGRRMDMCTPNEECTPSDTLSRWQIIDLLHEYADANARVDSQEAARIEDRFLRAIRCDDHPAFGNDLGHVLKHELRAQGYFQPNPVLIAVYESLLANHAPTLGVISEGMAKTQHGMFAGAAGRIVQFAQLQGDGNLFASAVRFVGRGRIPTPTWSTEELTTFHLVDDTYGVILITDQQYVLRT